MDEGRIKWIIGELRKYKDIDDIYRIIEDNAEIFQNDEMFETFLSFIEKEKESANNEIRMGLLPEEQEIYEEELKHINLIIGILKQRKAIAEEEATQAREVEESYPFMKGNSRFKVFFLGYSLEDTECIPENKLSSILGCIQNELATELIVSNVKGIKHTNEKKKAVLSPYNIKFERKRIGDYRIAFYRKDDCIVIIGIVKKSGNDIDYNRYDAIADRIGEIEEDRKALLKGRASSNSDHQKTIEVIFKKLRNLQPDIDFPLETFIPDLKETFTEEDIAGIAGTYHSEWYYMYKTLKGIYDKYSSISEEVLRKFPDVDFIRWIKEQKKLFRTGNLRPKRVKLLEELGIQFHQIAEETPSEKGRKEEQDSPQQENSETRVWHNPLLSLRIQELESLGDEFLNDFQTVVDYYQTRGSLKTTVGLKSDIDAINVRQILRKWKRSSFKDNATPLQLQLINELLKVKEPIKHQIKESDVSKDEQNRIDNETIDKILDLTEAYYLTYGTTRIPPHYKVDGFDLGECLERLRQLVLIPGAVSIEQVQRIKELSKYSVEETDHHTEVNDLFASEERRVKEKKDQLKDMIDEMSEEEIDTLMELLRNTSSK